MYSLFSSNDKNESLYLLKSGITSLDEAMKAPEECDMSCKVSRRALFSVQRLSHFV